MNILVVGGGGREHAIIKKLSESRYSPKLFAAPGNGGIAELAVCLHVSATDIPGVLAAVKEHCIDLVFVASDDPLMLGMVDELENIGVRAFGPKKNAAIIEGSKRFAKNFMKKYNIPTAVYEVFSDAEAALDYIKTQNKYPIVIKADGLAVGKGALIAESWEQAESAVNMIMHDKIFGNSGNNIIVEEFMIGREVTVLAFTDGKTLIPMVSAQDHKRAFDGDKGLNTGGMGTLSPCPYYSDEISKYAMERIFIPTILGLQSEGITFKGVIYFELMLNGNEAKVIEYNARFGDPEAQVVLPRLKTDFIDIINAVIDEKLNEINIEWDDGAAACIIMASGGYPGKYETGYPVKGLDAFKNQDNITIYHAGTVLRDGEIVTSGGRVLGVTAKDESLSQAVEMAYKAVDDISFKDCHYRKDIGKIH